MPSPGTQQRAADARAAAPAPPAAARGWGRTPRLRGGRKGRCFTGNKAALKKYRGERRPGGETVSGGGGGAPGRSGSGAAGIVRASGVLSPLQWQPDKVSLAGAALPRRAAQLRPVRGSGAPRLDLGGDQGGSLSLVRDTACESRPAPAGRWWLVPDNSVRVVCPPPRMQPNCYTGLRAPLRLFTSRWSAELCLLGKSGRSAEPSFVFARVCVCVPVSVCLCVREPRSGERRAREPAPRRAPPSHLELVPDVAVLRTLNYRHHRWDLFS